jgi:hypothetical protein
LPPTDAAPARAVTTLKFDEEPPAMLSPHAREAAPSTPQLVRTTRPFTSDDSGLEIAAVMKLIGASPFAEGKDEAALRLDAARWVTTGHGAAEVGRWLAARCFSPVAASELADAGVEPEDAAALAGDEGNGQETVGFLLSSGALTVMQALDVLGLLGGEGKYTQSTPQRLAA